MAVVCPVPAVDRSPNVQWAPVVTFLAASTVALHLVSLRLTKTVVSGFSITRPHSKPSATALPTFLIVVTTVLSDPAIA
jgi:hypothetical protein